MEEWKKKNLIQPKKMEFILFQPNNNCSNNE